MEVLGAMVVIGLFAGVGYGTYRVTRSLVEDKPWNTLFDLIKSRKRNRREE